MAGFSSFLPAATAFSSMGDTLTKASLEPLDGETTKAKGGALPYNPSKIKIKRSGSSGSSKVGKCDGKGKAHAGVKAEHPQPDKLSFEFMLDTSSAESSSDRTVLTAATDFALMSVPVKIDDVNARLPVVKFSWNKLCFVGIVKNVDIEFTLFAADGTPMRANIDIDMEGRAFDSTVKADDIYDGKALT